MNKLTIRDLDAAGKRVFVRVRFQRSPRGRQDHGRQPDRGRPADDQSTAGPGRRSSSWPATSAVPTARSRTACACGPSPSGSRQLLKMPVAVTGDALGAGTEDAIKRLKPGECILLENLRFHAEEEKNDPEFAKALASLRGRLRQRRLRHGPPRPRLHRGHRPHPAGLRGPADGEGDRVPRQAHGEPGAALRRDHRRGQGLRQDQGPAQPRRQGRHPGHRRRHGQHLPARPGQAGRQEPGRAGSRRGRQGDHGLGRGARHEDHPAHDVVVAKEVTRGTEYKTLSGRQGAGLLEHRRRRQARASRRCARLSSRP